MKCLRRNNKQPVDNGIEEAKESLAHAREDEVTVSKVVEKLMDFQARNHFGRTIFNAATFQEKKK